MGIAENIEKVKEQLAPGVCLVAVSKTKPLPDLQEAYEAGQRVFGENKVQEMVEKQAALPADIPDRVAEPILACFTRRFETFAAAHASGLLADA